MTANLGGPEDKGKNFRTLSGLEVNELYTQDDVEGLDYDRDLGLPGSFPFTRGPIPLCTGAVY